MAILRDNRGRIEGRSRAHDGADIVRIGNLIEHHQRTGRVAAQYLVKEDILQRIAIEHQSLMRRIARDQPGQVSRLGIFDREIGGQFAIKRGNAFAGCPKLAVVAIRVLECGFDRVAAPQPHRPGTGPARTTPALHAARAATQGAAGLGVTITAHVANPLSVGGSLGDGGGQG